MTNEFDVGPDTSKQRIDMSEDVRTPTVRSESAFSWTGDEAGPLSEGIQCRLNAIVESLSVSEANQIFRAVRYGHAVALLVPLRLIPYHTKRDDVLRVMIVRSSRPEQEIVLYTTHLPGFQRAYLDLALASASYGEAFRILEVSLLGPEEFAREYNECKPRGLENTDLTWEGGFAMVVDGARLQLRHSAVRTYQGEVVLDGRLEDSGAIKIQKKTNSFEVRLKDHSLVTSIRKNAAGVELTYQRTDHDSHPHRRIVANYSWERLTDNPKESVIFDLRFKVKSVAGTGVKTYGLEADEATLLRIKSVLESARDIDEFRKFKGDIAEDVVKQLAPSLGIKLRRDHPFNKDLWRRGSERTGPDLLVSIDGSSELCYVEVKWWDNAEDAYNRAKRQLLSDLLKHPTWEGQKVVKGYTTIFDWKIKRGTVALIVSEVLADEMCDASARGA